jgi:hypothetical protein
MVDLISTFQLLAADGATAILQQNQQLTFTFVCQSPHAYQSHSLKLPPNFSESLIRQPRNHNYFH